MLSPRQSANMALVFSVLVATPILGQDAPLPKTVAPSPLQDDANLHDIQFLGRDRGWAVGDHGVIWHTADGGRHWQLVESPVRCPLRSICFLTDRVGWIAGGGTRPYTRIGYGVVLFTNDGGATWQQLARDMLPPLAYVRFFGLEEGVAVGEPLPQHPSGVYVTTDGGQSWKPLDSTQSLEPVRQTGILEPMPVGGNWRAADFTSPDHGVVAGLRGRVALTDGEQLLAPRVGDLGLRGLTAVPVARDHTGWLVGDGGLVLRTENGGVVWQPPPAMLPTDLQNMTDFRTVEMRGQNAWIAGSPGTVIWHTPDGGRTWVRQFTGQSTPIHRICFTSETRGSAVGALGLTLVTDDGGRTWHAVRGGGRRLALLAMHARGERVSFPLLVEQSGDLGYRSGVLVPVRWDLASPADGIDLQMHEAVTVAGGSVGRFGWQFPIDVPGLDRNSDRLVEEWNRRTEGRLADALLGRLVAQIRTWRPNILVLDEAPSEDAATRLLNEAALAAVRQAADPTRFIEHFQTAGLQPWTVERVYVRLPAGSAGQAHVDLHKYLPRLGTTVQLAAASAAARVNGVPRQTALREAYRLVYQATGTQPSDELPLDGLAAPSTVTGRADSIPSGIVQFFTGIPLAPGSDARRQLLPIDEDADAIRRKIAERQRNFQAYAERFLDDSRQAAQTIAQLTEITAGMSNEQAALQLAQLAKDYRQRSQWEYVEATLIELINRYPAEPAAHEAMSWLIQFWSGAEPAYQRLRKTQASRHEAKAGPDVEQLAARIDRALQLANTDPAEVDPSLLGADPLQEMRADESWDVIGGATPAEQEWHARTLQIWQRQALQMGILLRRVAPALYRTPEVQFPLAALLRQHGPAAYNFYQRYQAGAQGPIQPVAGTNDPWARTAQAEEWLTGSASLPPKPVAVCRFTSERPTLDGILSDQCWRKAKPIPLAVGGAEGADNRDQAAQTITGPFAMLAYDVDFLYLAVSLPRATGVPADGPQLSGRRHDADLSRHDRVALHLDVDRDYSTWYSLEIDQRGWTRDSCWGDSTWNPKWYVAAEREGDRWRIEAAVPLKELVPVMPVKNDVWAMGLVRTIPAMGLESWTRPAAAEPRPETFGLLRFTSEND